MLDSLTIKNYAIIEELEVSFNKGLNIITGETGAGKSIILGALGLILGKRADHSSLFDKNKKCIIRGVFSNMTDSLLRLFKELDIEIEDDVILQREVSSKGSSKAYINDTPVNLKTLNRVGRHMVDLHQQFDQLDILDKKRQYEIIDAYCGQLDVVTKYQSLYQSWTTKKNELTHLREKRNNALREYDFIKFQVDELVQADISPNEEIDIERQLSMQTHAESLTEHLTEINRRISESDNSILDVFRSTVKALDGIENLPEHIDSIKLRIYSLIDELSDLARESDNVANDIEYSPTLIDELTNRINLINTLSNKHHVQNTQELLNLLSKYSEQLTGYESMDNSLEALEQEIKSIENELSKLSRDISKKRLNTSGKIEKAIIRILQSLEMKKAQFKVHLEPSKELNLYGSDQISFLFTANSGSELQNIKNAASGGELSRLNLSLKSIVADKIDLQTMILDEIDTGISGHVAQSMGFILKDLAKKHQIISITHSPQIASCGTHHLYVYKEVVKKKTQTRIKILDSTERIHNIAIMLSANPPSKSALKNAEELLEIT